MRIGCNDPRAFHLGQGLGENAAIHRKQSVSKADSMVSIAQLVCALTSSF